MAYWGSNLVTGTTVAAALTSAPTYSKPAPSVAQAGQIAHQRAKISFASGVNLAINDVIEMMVIPARHVVVDFVLTNSDMDTATTVVCQAGMMTGTPGDITRVQTAVGAELIPAGATVLQAAALSRAGVVAGGVTLASTLALQGLEPATTDKSIGIAITTAPTNPATARDLILDVWYKAV